MNAYLWPETPRATRTEILDRARLDADLDEATDPESPPSVLLVVGVPRTSTAGSNDGRTPDLAQFGGRFAENIVRGSIYRTRSTEICALLDIGPGDLVRLLDSIKEGLRSDIDARLSFGFVELPAEDVPDAVAALTLADSRLLEMATELRSGTRQLASR